MSIQPAPLSPAGHCASIVSCTVGSEQYAFRAGDASEIIRAERMRRATAADGTAGTVDVNGETVPVYALHALLRRSAAPPPPPRLANHIVVTRGQAGSVGWLVDRITRSATEGVVPVPLPRILGPVATRWFEGLLRVGDRALLLMSPAHLDPRAPADTVARPDRDARLPADSDLPPAVQEERAAPLVVLFSSPGLPRCSAPQYALSARRVVAVIQSLPVIVVPGSARHVAGVVLWRDGFVVPIIDGRPPDERRETSDRTRYIVARCAAAHGGLVAFEATGAVTLHQPTRADRQIEDRDLPPFVAGVFGVAGDPVALLDLDGMLSVLSGGQ